MKAEEFVQRANIRLKGLGLAVTLELRGTKLYIRGTFPPKPNSKKKLPHRQRLSLGLTATNPGLKMAEREAIRIGEQLQSNTFSWITIEKYQINKEFTVEECLKIAEDNYFKTRERNKKTIHTWETGYKIIWNQMGKENMITQELIRGFILNRNIGYHRNRAITVCRHICKSIGMVPEIDDLYASKLPRKDTTSDAPTDEEILFYFDKIQAWSKKIKKYEYLRQCHVWIYGMMATYGLRPHETMFVQWNKNNTINVLEHKTDKYYGARRNIYPFPKDWVEKFDLRNGNMDALKVPRDDYKMTNYYGRKIWYAFRYAEIPFKPYMLRHAYAIRLMAHHVEINVSASMMGHRPQTHLAVYRERFNEKIKEKMMKEAYDSFGKASSIIS